MNTPLDYMQRVLQLAEKGRYTVAPNPMVACLIERNNEIIAEAWHQKAGEAHAEILALQQARENAKAANVYINLEPCSHHGRTPPCVDALIKAQVASVTIPFTDPNPLVNGNSIKKLEEAGIQVNVGICAEAAAKLNDVFIYYMTHKRPFVIAKWAMSLDGKIATTTGHSQWITGEEARLHAHQTRNACSAILVGAHTAKKDNPQLTVRLPNAENINQPMRIILTNTGDLPTDLTLFSLPGKTIIATTEAAAKKLKDKRFETLILPTNAQNKICLNTLLTELGNREITSLLVEGGSETLTSFFNAGLVNKIHAYIAPKLIGGKNNSPVSDLGITHMKEAKQFTWKQCQHIGKDIFLETEFRS